MIYTIELGTLFDVVFLDFWEPGDISYRYGSSNILTCLNFI